jgi:hypothetical protein
LEYRERMGHHWLGLPEEGLRAWLAGAGFERVRVVPLAPDPAARGPALFAATAVRGPRPKEALRCPSPPPSCAPCARSASHSR